MAYKCNNEAIKGRVLLEETWRVGTGEVLQHSRNLPVQEGGDTQGDAVTMYHEGYNFTCQEGRCIVTDFISIYIYLRHGFLCMIQIVESPPSLSTLLPLLLLTLPRLSTTYTLCC